MIALHSYKGGTGKTVISSNLAVIYARSARKVVLLDYDFRAPSLHVVFKFKPKHWLNDFIDGNCSIEECLTRASSALAGPGELLVGLADPSAEAMRKIMTRERKDETISLQSNLRAKERLLESLHADRVILDTSPGLQFSSINALAVADVNVLVMKMDQFDLEGTKELVRGVYDALGRRSGIVVNRLVGEAAYSSEARDRLRCRIETDYRMPLLAVLPCFCDVQFDGGLSLYTAAKPDHMFTRALTDTAKAIDSLCGSDTVVGKQSATGTSN
jgi:septum site-determining protein MinD